MKKVKITRRFLFKNGFGGRYGKKGELDPDECCSYKHLDPYYFKGDLEIKTNKRGEVFYHNDRQLFYQHEVKELMK